MDYSLFQYTYFALTAVLVLFFPGFLLTVLFWKSMRFDERMALSPLLSMGLMMLTVKMLAAFSTSIFNFSPVSILLFMNGATFLSCLLALFLLRHRTRRRD